MSIIYGKYTFNDKFELIGFIASNLFEVETITCLY